ncbi:MAG: zinc finger domain-containing protein [Bacteroidales bacterium]|jgi:formamidopyrimidine-DNA glycosylase
MLEIPESKTISIQAGNTLINKKITEVHTATKPHKFAFYCGDPEEYEKLLTGKQIKSTKGHGMFVDMYCDEKVCITIGDGTNMRYYSPSEQPPEKYQLLIIFDDDSFVAYTVAMYGGIWAYKGTFDNPYYQGSLNSIPPLNDRFDEPCFDTIFKNTVKDLSLKALLATEQRIPGLGNGVLQDILFNAHLHPKRKKSTITDSQKAGLFHSLKETLKKMTDKGGRDTEKDMFGHTGGYKTVLSKNTLKDPCPNCGNAIVKEAYLGGAVYFCPVCQAL